MVVNQLGCLVEILGSVRTNLNTGVQCFWLWASAVETRSKGDDETSLHK